jgi:hypothetical protein
MLSVNQFNTIHTRVSWFCICGAPKQNFESFFSFLVVLNKVVDVLNEKRILYIEGIVEHKILDKLSFNNFCENEVFMRLF